MLLCGGGSREMIRGSTAVLLVLYSVHATEVVGNKR